MTDCTVYVSGSGNQLEARRLPSSNWYKLWLDVWQLRSSRLRDWADTIKIVYDREKRVSRNVEGVETRVPGWGNTETVEYLGMRVSDPTVITMYVLCKTHLGLLG